MSVCYCVEFPELFMPELGCLKDYELEISFKPGANPVFYKPPTVPFAILEDLNAAYDVGIRNGVWVPTHFNDYGTPVVSIWKALLPVQKKAKIQVCGDTQISNGTTGGLDAETKWWIIFYKD